MKRALRMMMMAALCMVPNMGWGQESLVMASGGTSQSSYMPIHGIYCDQQQRGQSLYPASMLEGLTGAQITALHYFVNTGSSSGWSDGVFTVKIGETTQDNLSSTWASPTNLTTVYTGTLTASVNGGMHVTFSTPYTYYGGNLVIQFQLDEAVSYSPCTFYGMTMIGGSRTVHGVNYLTSNGMVQNFLPQVEVYYTGGSGGSTATCPAPQALIATNVDGNGFDLSWLPADGNNGPWVVMVEDMVEATVTEPNYHFSTTGFPANKRHYNMKVGTLCGNNESYYAPLLVILPNSCTGISNSFVGISEVTDNSFRVTAELTVSDINDLWVYDVFSNYPFSSGTVSFDHSHTFEYLNPGTYYTVGVRKICMDTYDTSSYGYATVRTLGSSGSEPAPCPTPTNIEVTNLTPTTATLTWTGSGTSYGLLIDALSESVVSENHYTLTNLTPGSSHFVYLYAQCADGQSSSGVTINFTTPNASSGCDPITTLPWSCNFDDLTVGEVPQCWTKTDEGTAAVSSSQPYSGTSCLRFSGATGDNVILLPEINADYSNLQMRLMTRPEMISAQCGSFSVGYVTNPANASTFVPLSSFAYSAWTSPVAYAEKIVPLSSVPSGARLALCHDATSTYYYWFVDDITIESASNNCLAVTNLIVTSATSSTLTLAWTPATSGASYTIYNMADNSVVASGITGSGYTVSGLAANQSYTFGVQTHCTNGDATIVTVTGSTTCQTEQLPYTEDFSAEATCWLHAHGPSAAEVFAGATLNESLNSWIYKNQVSNGLPAGHYAVNIYGTNMKRWFVSPSISLAGVSAATLSFDAAFTSYTGTNPAYGFEDNSSQVFMVVVSTDDGLTWSEANAVKWQNSGGQHTLAELAGTDYQRISIDLTPYVGQTIRIAFYGQSLVAGGDNNLHIDNIQVAASTGCNATLPCSCDFENTAEFQQCWTVLDYSDGVNAPGLYSSAAFDGTAGFSFSSYNLADAYDQYLISPSFTSTEPVTLQFVYRGNSYGETFLVGYSTTDANPSSFTWGSEIVAAGSGQWYSFSETFPANTKHIAIHYTSEYLYDLHIDNLSIGSYPCPEVPQQEIETLSACDYLIWNGNWYLESGEYSYTAPDANGCDVIHTLQLTIHLSGYTDEQTICATGSFPWHGTDYTASAELSGQFVDDIGCNYNEVVHLTVSPDCCPAPTGFSTYVPSGENADELLDGDVALRWDWSATDANHYSLIYVEVGSQDTMLYDDNILYSSVFIRGLTVGTQYLFRLRSHCSPYASSSYADLLYTPQSVCPEVTDLVVTDVTATSVTLSWTPATFAGATYTVQTTEGTGATRTTHFSQLNANSCTVTGLNPSTLYTFYVLTECPNTPILPSVFVWTTTLCNPVVLPYTEGFETVDLLCWHNESGDSWSIGTGDHDYYTGAHSGNQNLKSSYNDGQPAKIISPEFDLSSVEEPALSFWYINRASSAGNDELRVYYRTATSAPWQLLTAISDAHQSWTQALLSLPSDAVQIAFESVGLGGPGIGIDDVFIGENPCIITSFPWIESFDASTIPFCWSSSYAFHSSSYGAVLLDVWAEPDPYIPDDPNLYTYYGGELISPFFDLSNSSNTLLNFRYINKDVTSFTDEYGNYYGSYDDDLQVFYRTSRTGDWHLLDFFGSSAENWTEAVLTLPPDAVQIKFSRTANHGSESANVSIYIDNVSIGVCPKVSHLAVSDLSHNSVTLSWSGHSNLGATYSVSQDGTVIASGLTATTYTATGLIPNTEYTFTVTAHCTATESSDPVSVSVTTPCAPITTFPWSETFDAGVIPLCWASSYTSGLSSYHAVYLDVWAEPDPYIPDDPSLYTYYGGELITPPFDLSSVSNPSLSFLYINKDLIAFTDEYGNYNGSNNDDLLVYYRTSPSGAWQLLSSYGSGADSWTQVLLDLPSDAVQIKFSRTANHGSESSNIEISIDNVSIEERPCVEVSNLAASNVTPTSVTLTWTDNLNSGATYTVSQDGTEIATDLTATTYTISDLQPLTTYLFTVTAHCSPTQSSDPASLSVTTLDPCLITTYPWSEDFEAVVLSDCWTTDGPGTWEVSDHLYIAQSGNYHVHITHSSTGNVTKLISPEFDLSSTTNPQLSFWYINYYNVGTDELRVYYRTSGSNPWQQLTSITDWHGSWAEVALPLPSDAVQIAFEMTDNDGYGLGIDNIVIESCSRVHNLTVSNITETSVTLSWTGNSGTTYSVSRDGTEIATGLTASTYTATGLSPMTTYHFTVTAHCSATEASTPVSITARTACGTITTLPWSDDVENSPYCWTYDGDGAWSIGKGDFDQTIGTHSGRYNYKITHSNNGDATYLYSPEINLSNSSHPQLSFWFINRAQDGNNDHLSVYYATQTGNYYYFTLAITEPHETWTQAFVSLPSDVFQIAFGVFDHNGYGVGIDDIMISEPTCAMVSDLTAADATQNSITLSWNANGNTGATYSVSQEGTEIATGLTATSYTATGLIPNTAYTFTVTAHCSASESSSPATITATTLCAPITTFPWSEGFEAAVDCWRAEGPGTWRLGTGDYDDATGTHSGSYNVYILHENTGDVSKLISPEFDLSSLAHPQLSFWYINRAWDGEIDELRVYYRTSGSASWQQLMAITDAHGSWTEAVLPLPADAVQVAFEVTDNYGYGVGFDDIGIEDVLCAVVTNLAVSDVSASSVSLTWTGGGDAGATYSLSRDGEVIATGLTATGYTATGLTANTDYTFAVTAHCSATEASVPVSIGVRTPCAAIVAFPWSEGFEGGEIPACWTQSGQGTWIVGRGDEQTYVGTHGGSYNARTAYTRRGYVTRLVSPELDLAAVSNPQLSFWYINRAWGGDIDELRVYYRTGGVGSDEGGVMSEEWVELMAFTEAHGGWTEAVIPLPAGARQVAFEMTDRSGWGVGIDDVAIEGGTCVRVTGLAVSEVTESSVSLTWTGGGGAATYSVSRDGEVIATGLTGTSYTATGLSPVTSYLFAVTTHCSETEASSESSIGVRTECGVIGTFPWSEDFERGVIPLCWSTEGGGSWWVEQNFLFHYARIVHVTVGDIGKVTKLISPEFDLTGVGSPQLSFRYVNNRPTVGSADQLRVYYRTGGVGSDEWVELMAATSPHGNWTREVLALPAEARQVAFEMRDHYGLGVNLDDIRIEGEPCGKVTNLAVGGATATSVTLTWNDNGTAGTTYTVGLDGTTVATGLTATSYTATGVGEGEHTFSVTADCATGNHSDAAEIDVTMAKGCDSYMWHGRSYSNSGVYEDGGAVLALTVNYNITMDIFSTECSGYSWYEHTNLTTSQTVSHTIQGGATGGCDLVQRLHLTIQPCGTVEVTACDSYQWKGKTLSSSGTYEEDGETLILTILHSERQDLVVEASGSYSWYEYENMTTSQSVTHVVEHGAANGCDLIQTLHLSISPSAGNKSAGCDTVEACGSYEWRGFTIGSSGRYVLGGDTLELTVRPTATGDTLAKACNSFDWYEHTGLTDTVEVTHAFTAENGCDSVVTLHLDVMTCGHTEATACDSYEWKGFTVESSGTYISGYDTLSLTLLGSTTGDTTAQACEGYLWRGEWREESGEYLHTTTNAAGCDSTVTLHLTVHYGSTSNESLTACDYYDWRGQFIDSSGTYTDSSADGHGCIGHDTLQLTLLASVSAVEEVTACNSYVWHGEEYSSSTLDPIYTLPAANGCDSTVTLHLTIDSCSTTEITVCGSYFWNGEKLNTSGLYTYGSDTLLLTVHQPSASELTDTACDSYLWNGYTFTASGDYTYFAPNAVGCDSTVTLHLTVLQSSLGDTAVSVCDRYMWNGAWREENGEYSYTSTNIAGCDSTATLHLTILHGNLVEQTVTVCDSYLWNGVWRTESGEYSHTSVGTNGCIDTATLHLTVNHSTAEEDTVTACNSCSWNGTLYIASGEYSHTVAGENGCDSTVMLHLTVNRSSVSEETVTAEEEYYWHGQTLTHSGVYTYSTENAAGCDSTVTLYLTIVPGVDSCTLVLTVNDVTMGTTDPAPGSYILHEGETATVRAIAFPGYRFTGWEESGVPLAIADTFYTFTVTPDMAGITTTLTALFAEVQGIGDVENSCAVVYVSGETLCVDGCRGRSVTVFDLFGRILYRRDGEEDVRFEVPVSGVYFVKVGDNPARRIAVVR